MEQRAFDVTDLELRTEEGGKQKLSGYFIEWDKLSNPILGYFQEKFSRGAFKNLDSDIRALWHHDTKQVLGRAKNGTLTITEDERGARFEIIPDSEISWHRDAIRSIKRGDVSEMSFMFQSHQEEWDDSSEMSVRTILEADLYEISPVTWAAYPTTNVDVRSAKDVYQSRSTKRGLTSVGLYRKRLELISREVIDECQ
ncbi:HK97 family phage prohead protease [Thermoactinomyces sp. DSM 45892]|uniref:HK97 family phage prohead protease n=1 Tax=Thermoactinomyces sp. DSM 45892 TaxID=1882753 RepID=UPI00089D4FA5|nr:HK97 family phage prohead protease [Thermoactinomyces sp. DSM 45892]SDY69313.1 prohead peptidase. Unknown type peptidase. MEROPS family U35 [Thermoactinomyces sp. DSM 45892]